MMPEDEKSLDDNEIEGAQDCDVIHAQTAAWLSSGKAAPMQVLSTARAPP
jgi:hypothetical protein